MGCLWSSQGTERCLRCSRRAVNNLVIIDNLCEICIHQAASHSSNAVSVKKRPFYGEYKCVCGRFWSSRLSWQDCYQICKRCKRQVYPNMQRELRASDSSSTNENVVEHARELCQMCQQLGDYCGRFRAGAGAATRAPPSGTTSSNRTRSKSRTRSSSAHRYQKRNR